jgi:hypothetical protein
MYLLSAPQQVVWKVTKATKKVAKYLLHLNVLTDAQSVAKQKGQ